MEHLYKMSVYYEEHTSFVEHLYKMSVYYEEHTSSFAFHQSHVLRGAHIICGTPVQDVCLLRGAHIICGTPVQDVCLLRGAHIVLCVSPESRKRTLNNSYTDSSPQPRRYDNSQVAMACRIYIATVTYPFV